MRTARHCLLGLAFLPLIGCGSPAPVQHPPPLDQSHESSWEYGAYLLSLGDATGARSYLEVSAAGPLSEIVDPPFLFRDLSEARLMSGDMLGAAGAAQDARLQLARKPLYADFKVDDQRLFERVVDGLEAAANDDFQRLSELAADESGLPSADAWYLLGWLAERHGDLPRAQAAYRGYLARSPQWAFLREAVPMRRHALDVVR